MTIVALLARCDLHRPSTATPLAIGPRQRTPCWSPYLGGTQQSDERSASFDVAEFAVLDDGRRVLLHHERGFTIGGGSSRDPWAGLTEELLERNVLMTVSPDDDGTMDEHPYEWLADLCRRRGLQASVDDLRRVPYVVELSEPLIQRLPHPSLGED